MSDLLPRLDLTNADDTGLPSPANALLGPRRRKTAGLAAAIALLSFFVPLIATDTPVLGRTHWSPCQVFEGYLSRTLPINMPSDPQEAHAQRVFIVAFAMFGSYQVEYLGLLALLLAIAFYPRAKLVGALAALIGADVYWSLKYYEFSSYQEGIYGPPAIAGQPMAHFTANGVFLLVSMGLVLLVVAWRDFEA
jgi:hypothetical protein